MEFPFLVPVPGSSESMIHIYRHIHMYLLKCKAAVNETDGPDITSVSLQKV